MGNFDSSFNLPFPLENISKHIIIEDNIVLLHLLKFSKYISLVTCKALLTMSP